jgi:hypothetical protein
MAQDYPIKKTMVELKALKQVSQLDSQPDKKQLEN